LDASSLLSVRRCAEAFLSRKQPIHCLVHNAGVMHVHSCQSADGIELQWQVNFLAPFYLTQLLLPLLLPLPDTCPAAAPARVVCVSSLFHAIVVDEAGVDFAGLQRDSTQQVCRRFGESKLALLLFVRALARRMATESSSPLLAVSLSPGYIPSTRHNRHISVRQIFKTVAQCCFSGKHEYLKKLRKRSIPMVRKSSFFQSHSPHSNVFIVIIVDYCFFCDIMDCCRWHFVIFSR
jgi:NAD(P)-dependent dehydrogenase (short-subunit alcohol dehydrogenase family)